MKLGAIDNIWKVETRGLSNAVLAQVYFERAKAVVAHALADRGEREAAVRGQKFRRKYLAQRIGAQYSVMFQNPSIRHLLRTVDAALVAEFESR